MGRILRRAEKKERARSCGDCEFLFQTKDNKCIITKVFHPIKRTMEMIKIVDLKKVHPDCSFHKITESE